MLTNDQARDLGLRAVSCAGWRWLPGSLSLQDEHGRTYRALAPEPPQIGTRLVHERGRRIRQKAPPLAQLVPDFRDPCTLGGLLALVREAWGDQFASVQWSPDAGWFMVHVGTWPAGVPASGPSEAEALVAALEADPGAGGEG